MRVRVIIPIGSLVRTKIRNTYTTLYEGYCKNTPPHLRTYTRKKLSENIRQIVSVGRITINTDSLLQPRKDEWVNKGYKVFSFHSWFFAVILTKSKRGIIRAEIQDGFFNGDYHNDVKNTKPWDEGVVPKKKLMITESQLRRIIREAIRKIIA